MNNIRDKKLLIAFGTHLKKTRIDKGFTQKQLANEMDVEISQISRIERGIGNPTLSTLSRLSEILGIKLPQLLTF